MNKKKIPVIIGVAQFTQRKGTSQPLDPLRLMIKTSQKAIDDTNVNSLVDFIDAVYMVNIISWSYEDAPGELSEKLNITPKEKVYLGDGGNSPQMLINRAAKSIFTGIHRSVLITGGEAGYTGSKIIKNTLPKSWPPYKSPKYMEKKIWGGIDDFERLYGFRRAAIPYAIFESAIRTISKRSLEDHTKYLGDLFTRFSKVASKNPFSWTQKYHKAEEITTPSLNNRYITYPYTKRMCANNFVDQSASVIVTSQEVAELLKIDPKHCVYLMGSADLNNIHEITRRPLLYDSPAIKESSNLALKQAGLTLDDIDKFDIYSCFPSIVEIIMRELGIKKDDPRNLTITGGLPYFGAPLSVYSLHAIVTAVGMIRDNPSLNIMVLANGGYNSGESVGIYGSQPPYIPWSVRDDTIIQQSIIEKKLPLSIEKANGSLTVDAYTIMYDRLGKPKRVIVIGTLENGLRTIAITKNYIPKLLTLEKQDLVGRIFVVQYDSTVERNILKIY